MPDGNAGSRRLVAIKAVHTAVFLTELSSIGWLVASGIQGRRDRSVAIATVLVAIESAVFVLNRGVCPLTTMAEQEGAEHGSVSDIFLPDVVARTIPIWSSLLLVLAVALHARGWHRSRSGAGRAGDAGDAAGRRPGDG